MPTTIEVNKQSVEALLGSGKSKPFVIPEYQRPYAWTDEQVETLFEDLWEFSAISGGTERDGSYFLGSIVSYENEDSEQEIIDGQQRITSLFLLLRAIYTKLTATQASERTAEANNFIGKIEPAIWRTNKLTGIVDYKNILLTSRVVNNEGNNTLRAILETGEANETAKDNYSKNYRHFQALFDKHSQENPLMVYQFIYALLNQAILLPITADTQDTALTIFSTLNDRGLPLSDADIFKAKIYNQLNADDKTAFIERWKDLDEQASAANESIQQLFYYNMFYLRALEQDIKTTIPGVRKYYAANKFEKLYNPSLLDTLFVILNLWNVVNTGAEIEGESWSKNAKIKQSLDTLSSYPNEFWKYPVVIYYVCYRKRDDFEIKFGLFLNKLLMELMTKYLMIPSINAVKPDILKLNSAIVSSDTPEFHFKDIDTSQLELHIQNPNRNVVRMLLKILAYEQQKELLPARWEIEHIFPQKWQTNYFPDMSDATIKEKIEHIGNKLPFEKRLNIIAGNGYFSKKKKEYAASQIAITKAIGTSKTTEWDLDSITKRDIRISDSIIALLNKWDRNYKNISSAVDREQPSGDDLARIEKKGWI
ncbi:DUF262 domain-containing HNH endonuclease family protein [Oscillibacter sp.]|jgi:hypothetical protein|uniref:DUF262 domain-containing protein n=1 Tax=Oscillibacter sp. TaxID=1945593 RepID=UPI00216C44B2|nr:DUF262 domain-containing HNH endonuclease family protein [Oscillibacter sp.]MCI9648949.1 DUF262 domain-containing protein [Oscillibacter sp.]